MPTTASPRAAIPKAAAADVGRRIRARRLELGLTQADVAGVELTKQLISQIEMGRTRPSPSSLAQIARRLNVVADSLVGEAAVQWDAKSGDATYLLRSAEAMLASRQPERALETLAALSADELKPSDRVVHKRLLADIKLAQDHATDALADALVACRYTEESDDAEQIALAYNAVGRAQFQLNRLAAAMSYYDAGLDYAQKGDVDPALLARIQTNRGNALMRLGDAEAATVAYEHARLAAENAENLRSLAIAHMGLGEASRERGDYSVAVAHMESAVELFDRLENRRLQVHNLHNLGEAHAERGDLQAARRHHEAALAAATTIGDAVAKGYALERLAALDVREDSAVKAMRGVQEAIGIAKELHDDDLLARALATFGDACQRLGDTEQADSAYADAVELASSARGRALRHVLMQQGTMLRGRGDFENATAAFEAAAHIPY